MAIIQEHFLINDVDFIRSHSDLVVKIHGGVPEGDYDVADDPASLGRTYTETDIPVEPEAEPTAEEALSILLGGAEL